jgi:CRP/FNR family transcriptional regulator, cyclic AMP receptor protein
MATPVLLPDNLFSGLPAELSRDLFAKARILKLTANQMVFLAGDAGDGCYRIEEGLLKVIVGGRKAMNVSWRFLDQARSLESCR